MQTYANIFAVIPDLAEMNDWLMVDDDEWENDPKTAKIYIFDEDEMYDLEEQGLAKIGEYFDEFPLPIEFADKPIGDLLDSGNMEGVVYNLAKYLPKYSDTALIDAINYYREIDDYCEQKNAQVTMHLWAMTADPKHLADLKQAQQDLTAKLGNPLGLIWVKSNQPKDIVQMATLYGDGKFVDMAEFTPITATHPTANAVCLLADGAGDGDVTAISLPKYTGVTVNYLGKFDMIFNAEI